GTRTSGSRRGAERTSGGGYCLIRSIAVGALVPTKPGVPLRTALTMIGRCAHGVAKVPPRLQAGRGAPTSVIVNDPGAASETVRFAPSEAGSKTVPLSVRYGWSTIEVTVVSVDVAVITSRCLPVRYSTGVSVTLTGRLAVTVTLTSVTDEVPLAFVALTPNW